MAIFNFKRIGTFIMYEDANIGDYLLAQKHVFLKTKNEWWEQWKGLEGSLFMPDNLPPKEYLLCVAHIFDGDGKSDYIELGEKMFDTNNGRYRYLGDNKNQLRDSLESVRGKYFISLDNDWFQEKEE